MLDSLEPAIVSHTVVSGEVKFYLSFGTLEEAFASDKDGNFFTIATDNLKTQENYYLYVEPLSKIAEVTLLVTQKHQVITLLDGSPQTVGFQDESDTQKYMLFNLPPGTSTVVFYIKSQSPDFYPRLFLKLYNDTDSNVNVDFPPSSDPTEYQRIDQWDYDLYTLKSSLNFAGLTPGSFLALTLQYRRVPKSYMPKNDSIMNPANKKSPSQDKSASAVIALSHTLVTKLVAGMDYHGVLPGVKTGGNSFYRLRLFKVVNPGKSYLSVRFAQCVGRGTQFAVLRDPGRLEVREPFYEVSEGNGRRIGVVETKGMVEGYIIVEGFTKEVSLDMEYYIRVDFLDTPASHSQNPYMPANGGRITYKYVRGKKGEVKLSWSPLYSALDAEPVSNVRYKLIFSTNPDAVLDSVCALQATQDLYTVYEDLDGDNSF
jgi:hypothetical protein